MYALHVLVHFYMATKPALAHVNPLPKFMSVKLIVFATFWQSVAINGLLAVDARYHILDKLDLECTFGLPRISFGGLTSTAAC